MVSGKDHVMQKPPQTSSHFSSIDTLRNNRRGTGGWGTLDIEFDGNQTLLEQQTAINYTEQTKNIQLVCYQKGRVPKNSATAKQVPKGRTIQPLLMLELPASISVGLEVAAQLASGRRLVFYTVVYVKGFETKVAGFR